MVVANDKLLLPLSSYTLQVSDMDIGDSHEIKTDNNGMFSAHCTQRNPQQYSIIFFPQLLSTFHLWDMNIQVKETWACNC